ncbi:dephospho-CoA kinase [Lewinella sp. IMCC34183]|uniref:dephospho-CoA kinase n=1 Tax=Lewinella sp. IMCC34183 TaxID=2248762 RepID=UPI000E22967F|nr:dephospho-CoA kinase [Lewinella sp. IMCC34183]
MALRIGITGNIGAGKTTVCREFERLGVPIYYADARAKALMNSDPELREGIVTHFGPASYTSGGDLDRAYLAERAFADAGKLAILNRLVHPAVARDAAAWHATQTTAYTLHEAAILLEIGAADDYDSLVVVACPYPTRQARVLARDGITSAAFAERAEKQWPDARKEAAADHLIHNDGRRLILPQVLGLHRIFRESAAPNLPAGR